ncbi:MAG: DUF362 domain-containing protein [Deltaproteobacteria bacterium]|nr:DUF362 domain-containing protein [Deltaproteobacteria bacterium]
MSPHTVSIVRYEKPFHSVVKAVDLSRGLERLPAQARVFIKPNIVFWTKAVPFPKWGVVTTSRVVEDMVVILKEMGVRDITIGEGTVIAKPKDLETPAHAFQTLGYEVLRKRYGVRYVNTLDRPFEKIRLGEDIVLNFNRDILESDFVVNLPVLKTHSQTMVSLGIKNLKGTIDIPSRKKCHSPTSGRDLHYMVSKLFQPMPPMFTLLDGIYTHERGPNVDGQARRSNLFVASSDVLSADMVGARLLGIEPAHVPHLVHAARALQRPVDLSDVEIVGERVDHVASPHEWAFPYNEEGTLPATMERWGIKGMSFRKYDLTVCTYCAGLVRVMLMAIARAWKGTPFDDVEVLTGKVMRPTPGRKKTLLLGKCIYQANKDNPDIREMIAVKGCPPSPKSMLEALRRAGIEADPDLFEHMDRVMGVHMKRYRGKAEFDESHFRID